MRQLVSVAERAGLSFIPSRGNFLTIQFEQTGAEIYTKLLQQGIIVRPLVGYGLPNHLRVSVGLEAENERFCLALESIMSNIAT
jgi:histidinol-phosphate aminotransferase